jgi:hypothetical protein
MFFDPFKAMALAYELIRADGDPVDYNDLPIFDRVALFELAIHEETITTAAAVAVDLTPLFAD